MANSNVSLTKALKNVFDEQQNYDVTFLVDGEDIHAHKLILSVRSSVFKAMINNPISYFDGKIHISDPLITPTDFKNFLKFLYTDECEIKPENLEALLHLGNMYDVPLLLEKCVEDVEKNLDEINILEFAEFGLISDGRCSLLSKCLKKIPSIFFPIKNCRRYTRANHFSLMDVSHNLVLKIVQDCKRNGEFTEDKLFEAVLDWAKNEYLKNPEITLKEALKDILPFIKFENLKPITLATSVSYNDLLSNDELLNYIRKSVISETKEHETIGQPLEQPHIRSHPRSPPRGLRPNVASRVEPAEPMHEDNVESNNDFGRQLRDFDRDYDYIGQQWDQYYNNNDL